MTSLNRHDFRFPSGEEYIQASLDYCGKDQLTPEILSLHGAGPSNRQRISYLTTYLATMGFPCLRFDYSGHPDSTGKLSESSLKKRLDETKSALEFLRPGIINSLIATSMGGHIALELLPSINVQNLIFFCPAAYSSKAYDIPFGHGFSDIIRVPGSFNDANVFENLSAFKGNLLFIIGEHDEIIPKEVIELYKASSFNCSKREFLVIPGAPHAIHAWLEKNIEWKNIVISKVLNFLIDGQTPTVPN